MAEWPGGARGALCLSFDNLGEAAELELGGRPDSPIGEHFTAKRVLPVLLDTLAERGITATFFVEGLNAELYPEALREIARRGHEVAYHAWRHEQWGDLSAEEQAANLARGIEAFRDLGLGVVGMRPPGGQLGARGIAVLREAGLRYCSPGGDAVRIEDGVALLPFRWRHVDASCVLPPLSTAREEMTGSPAPVAPDVFLAYLEREIQHLATEGGFATIILHPFMLDWFGEGNLEALLNRISLGDTWVAPCDEVAAHALSRSR